MPEGSKRALGRASEGSIARAGAPDAPRVLRELALVYAWIVAVTLAVGFTDSWLTRDYGHLLLALAFLATALQMARRGGRPAADFGIDLCGLLEARTDAAGAPEPLLLALRRALPRLGTELGVALLCALLVFPPFVIAFRAWHQVEAPFSWHPPREIGDFMLGQLIVVALPEEALFRGYFQTRFSELFGRRTRLFGVQLSLLALSCQAALFALLHFLVGFAPERLAVFFPGLLFGVLREKRGGIGAAVWFHALSNLLSEVLTRGYL
jgi:membrane protease YdiL (CAAX protease family)